MYSKEHILYLKKQRKTRIFVLLTQLSIITLFLLIWQFLASKNMINTFIFSSPKNVWNTIVNLYKTNDLFKHIWITVYETIISFSIGTVLGLFIATLLWRFRFLARVMDPYLTILNSLPKVALGPIIIIWAGANMNSIIFMALLISVIVTIMNIYQGFVETDRNKVRLLQSLGASPRQIYFYLVLPGSIHNIISTLKINVSMSLIGIIMGEFLVSKEGIGYLIMYGSQVFNLNLVITGVFILCIVATVMYYMVAYFEKKMTQRKK